MGSRPTICIHCARILRRQPQTFSFGSRSSSSAANTAFGPPKACHLANRGYGFDSQVEGRNNRTRTFHSSLNGGHRFEQVQATTHEPIHLHDTLAGLDAKQETTQSSSAPDRGQDPWLGKYRLARDALVPSPNRPQASSYPSLPVELFEPTSGRAIRKACKDILPDGVNIVGKFRRIDLKDGEQGWRTVQILVDGKTNPVAAAGEGKSRDAAIQAAYTDLVAKMDRDGLLTSLWMRKNFSKARQQETATLESLGSDRFSKLQVFNYASRFGCFPKVDVRLAESQTGSLRFRAKISLPELGVLGIGEAYDVGLAETYAALHCKSQLEQLRLQESSERLDLRDYQSLNIDNAYDFTRFFLGRNPRRYITMDESLADPYNLQVDYSRIQILLDDQPLGPPVHMLSRPEALRVATLFAAVELTQRHPDLFAEYHHDLLEGRGVTSRRLRPVELQIDEPMRAYMQDLISEIEQNDTNLRKGYSIQKLYEDFAESRDHVVRLDTTERLIDQARSASSHMASTDVPFGTQDLNISQSKTENALPVREYSGDVLDIIADNPFCIISGTTGSGKSTQVPQIILEDALRRGPDAWCNIICTEPRRVAVKALSERVASERNERVGDHVGYRVGFDRVLPQASQWVTYCTPEILSLQIMHASEDVLANTSHIIVDEVHERNSRTDKLLSELKLSYEERRRAGKPFPKIILMSASLDGGVIENYFSLTDANGATTPCPTLTVPGRVHEVEHKSLEQIEKELSEDATLLHARSLLRDPDYEKYMSLERAAPSQNPSEGLIGWRSEWELSEDREEARISYALVAATIAKICKSDEKGAILAFLPGWNEMKRVEELLQRGTVFGLDFKDTSKFRISLLHSSNPKGMDEALTPVPDACRKILLSTNIAETSVTIPDVRFVVDSAKQRTPRYDHVRKLSTLDREWVSRSSVVQRAGRAGRTQPGTYYGLFSNKRRESLRPSIARTSIDSSQLHLACLRARVQFPDMSLTEYFAKTLEMPARQDLEAAVRDLQNIGALDSDQRVTLLGRLMGNFPTQPSTTRMILLGAMFRCLRPMVILAGFMTTSQPFFVSQQSLDDRMRADAIRAIYAQGTASDHIAALAAFDELQSIETREGRDTAIEWAAKSFLNFQVYILVKKFALQIERVLADRKIARDVYSTHMNVNSSELTLIKALLLAGVSPNVGQHQIGDRFITRSGTNAVLPRESASRPVHWMSNIHVDRSLCCYSRLNVVKQGGHLGMLRDVSMVTPLMTALFGGTIDGDGEVESSATTFQIDRWLPFEVRGGSGAPEGSEGEGGDALQVFVQFKSLWDQLTQKMLEELSIPEMKERWKHRDPLVHSSFVNAIVNLLNYESGMLEAKAQHASTTPAEPEILEESRRVEDDREAAVME